MKVSASKVASGKGSCSARPATRPICFLAPARATFACLPASMSPGEVHADDLAAVRCRQLQGHARGPVATSSIAGGAPGTMWSTMARRHRPFWPERQQLRQLVVPFGEAVNSAAAKRLSPAAVGMPSSRVRNPTVASAQVEGAGSACPTLTCSSSGAGTGGQRGRSRAGPGGAKVALVDKPAFPRDKACGDVVGPRGLQVLSDLGLAPPIGRDLGDMLVVGPTGRRVRLPSADGLTIPDMAPRSRGRCSTPHSTRPRSLRGPHRSPGGPRAPRRGGTDRGLQAEHRCDDGGRLRDRRRRRHE